MTDGITVPVDAPAMKTIADAANMALKAQLDLSMYRVVGIKIGTVSKNPIEYGNIEYIPASSKQVARTEYVKKYGSKLVNDSSGEWVIGCVAIKTGRDDC